MYETLVFGMFLIILNLILILKRIPLFGFTLGLFTLIIVATSFVSDTTLPVNTPTPYFALLIALVSGFDIIAQFLDFNKK